MRKSLATPFYGIPNDQQVFDFHMRTILMARCPSEKRLRRLFQLYKLAKADRVDWTEAGYAFVRDSIKAYKNASDNVITADFRFLRKTHLLFVYVEEPTEASRFFAELLSGGE